MKIFLRMAASAALSLTLLAGIGMTLTGCSAETLSGPNLDAYANTDTGGGGTSGGGSEHNLEKAEIGGGTSGGGSEHNLDG